MAENGVPLTWKNVDFFEQGQAALEHSAEAKRLYLGNGGPRPGKVVTYKELAGTFRQVAEGGAEAFYRGPIARAIARAVGEAGGWLTEADLAAFAPEWREPLAITYRGWEVSTVPPPFSAFQMLETLNILEAYDLARMGTQLGGPSPPPDRGDQARVGRPSRLCLLGRAAHARPRVEGLCRVPARAHRSGARGGERGRTVQSRQAARSDRRGPSRAVRQRANHALRLRRCLRLRRLGDADPRHGVRVGLCRARHRARAERHPEVDGPRSSVAERAQAGARRRGR